MSARRRLETIARGLRRSGRGWRWTLLSLATMGGWIGIGAWLVAQGGDFDGDEPSLWWLLVVCGAVGVAQAVALFPEETTPRERDARRRRRGAIGLLRWWQLLLLVVAHILVTILLVALLVPKHSEESRSDAALDVLVLGGFAWILAPIIVLLGVVLVGVVIGLTTSAVHEFDEAADLPESRVRERIRHRSIGIAILGIELALVCLIAAIPWLGVSGAGRGAGLAAIIVLFLESIGVLTGPDDTWALLDRAGYLLGIAAMLQGAIVPFLIGRLRRDRASS